MTANFSIDPAVAWAAVLARSTRFEGALFYGVNTTGVYCRPSCPSRRPKPENARFFSSTEEAERAGYRACLRCRPAETSRPHELVRRARELLDGGLEEPLTLASLGEALDVSPAHLQRTFKRVTGLTPHEYVQAARRASIRERLRTGQDLTRATYDAGFGSSSRVYEQTKALFGMTPGRFRRGGEGVSAGYGVTDCTLGKLILAASEQGVCFVAMGDSEEALEDELRRELPYAALSRADGAIAEYLAAAVSFIDGRSQTPDSPLDLRGTEFQLLVWKFLKSIRYGTTTTYREVARAIGRPRASRAVAQACATNPVALFVPCHRVVRSDDSPGGYRWGVSRKKALLDREDKGQAPEKVVGG